MNQPDASSAESAEAAVTVRVVSGEPTPEELAALLAVLAARAGGGGAEPARSTSTWASPARAVRGQAARSANAWRTSALPR